MKLEVVFIQSDECLPTPNRHSWAFWFTCAISVGFFIYKLTLIF